MVLRFNRPFVLVYENDPPVVTPPVVTPPEDVPTISQKKLNAILAEEKKKSEERTKSLSAQLEELKQKDGTSEATKSALEEQIQQLNNSLLTKDELTAKEKKELEKKSAEEKKLLSGEVDTWKSRFYDSTITRELTDAASIAEACSPAQIVKMIGDKATLVEEKDGEGKPTGRFVTKIKFNAKDKDGKPVVLDLTAEQAVKHMKDLPDEYGNLFKSTLAGGLGGSGNKGSGGRGQGKLPTDMTDTEYAKWRKENLK